MARRCRRPGGAAGNCIGRSGCCGVYPLRTRSRKTGPGSGLHPADKTGYGTSATTASTVWYTLQGGRLSEIYYPNISTPSTRTLEFVVSDDHSFAGWSRYILLSGIVGRRTRRGPGAT
jgi:hypothetical protein